MVAILQKQNVNNSHLLGKSMSESRLDKDEMMQFYNRTMTYLRNSFQSPKIKDIGEVQDDLEVEGSEFETLMLSEIKKFNTLKQ